MNNPGWCSVNLENVSCVPLAFRQCRVHNTGKMPVAPTKSKLTDHEIVLEPLHGLPRKDH